MAPSPRTESPRAATYLNAHTTNLALRRASQLAPLLHEMDLVYADGMSVVRAARCLGIAMPGRVSAADFFLRFCWAAAARRRPLALIGARPGVADSCGRHLQELVPGLKICFHHHGHFPEHSDEERRIAQALAAASPAIALVGMGSPRQERFALRLRDQYHLPATWCVGALFEYYAPGVRRHAPLWMREYGLEWAFRLTQEPRRLARRYLLGNIEFLLRTRGVLK